jgi:hypothetical protein
MALALTTPRTSTVKYIPDACFIQHIVKYQKLVLTYHITSIVSVFPDARGERCKIPFQQISQRIQRFRWKSKSFLYYGILNSAATPKPITFSENEQDHQLCHHSCNIRLLVRKSVADEWRGTRSRCLCSGNR